ncbi:MAG: hypothetical protein IPI67_18225 [Myxococcales bacterium]|nr:hypothetical protein [Myxococcales bacterium]
MSDWLVFFLAVALSGCVGSVPRPEPLAQEPLTPEDVRATPPMRKRATRPKALPACMPKALAQHGRVTLLRQPSPKTVAFCMRPEDAGNDTQDTPDSCFEWNLDTTAFRVLKPEGPAAAVMDDVGSPPQLKISAEAVSVCDAAGKCAPVVSAKFLPKPEQYRREADDRLLARASDDGALVALIHQRDDRDGELNGQIEVWNLKTKRKVRRFKITSQRHGDQISSLRFLGSVLLVEQCDAGPACTGRLFDATSGKALLEIPVNFYGSERHGLEAGKWLFVDGWLEGVAVVDVAAGRVVSELKSGLSGPPEDAGRVLRTATGELLFTFSGAGEGAEHANGGTLVRLDVTQGRVAARLDPPRCPE